MNEEEVAAGERCLQVAEEAEMRLWQGVVEGCLESNNLHLIRRGLWRDAIGNQSVDAPQPHPMIKQRAIGEALDRNLLVIALEKDAFLRLAMRDQPVDGFTGRRSPIDVVAQKYEDRLRHRASRHVLIDLCQQWIEEIE